MINKKNSFHPVSIPHVSTQREFLLDLRRRHSRIAGPSLAWPHFTTTTTRLSGSPGATTKALERLSFFSSTWPSSRPWSALDSGSPMSITWPCTSAPLSFARMFSSFFYPYDNDDLDDLDLPLARRPYEQLLFERRDMRKLVLAQRQHYYHQVLVTLRDQGQPSHGVDQRSIFPA